jgi:hypothetical protein
MSIDPIIEKIKKLLRMKRGGTPDEIATALRLAQELAAKHGINIGDVNPDEEDPAKEKPISHIDALISARIQCECKYAALTLEQFFKVTCLTRKTRWNEYRLTFIGTDWDTQIALYVYHFLVGHFRREWKTKRGRCRNRQAFMYGMYLGLCSKLRERQPVIEQKPGIIHTDRALIRRSDYMQKTFGDTSKKNCVPDDDASQARYRGYLAGRDTEIRSGVKAGDQQAANMLPPSEGVKLLH